jgi:hypothetical protein
MTEQSADLARLPRGTAGGGPGGVGARRPEEAIVSLCRCDGGEEADRFATTDPRALDYLAARDSSDTP